jgi:methionine sulfoxide reductase heme-binding subunit
LNRLWLWRVAAWGLGIAPLLVLVKLALQNRLGANPIEFLEHYLGDWTLRILLITLAMTPIRIYTHLTEPIRVRRVLGLWAFFYLCLHFSTYVIFDLGFSVSQLGEDLIKRTYITLGFAAWLLLVPLVVTSTLAWQRRLKRRWVTLHRLIYPAAILGAVHYLWLVKADIREPLIYLTLLLGLLAIRLPWPRWRASFQRQALSAMKAKDGGR